MIIEDKKVEYNGVKGIPHARAGDKVRKTGDWRVFKPIIDKSACITCRMCWISCPDAAISLDKDGYPTIDYGLCKGCLICEETCPKDEAITHIRDTHEGE